MQIWKRFFVIFDVVSDRGPRWLDLCQGRSECTLSSFNHHTSLYVLSYSLFFFLVLQYGLFCPPRLPCFPVSSTPLPIRRSVFRRVHPVDPFRTELRRRVGLWRLRRGSVKGLFLFISVDDRTEGEKDGCGVIPKGTPTPSVWTKGTFILSSDLWT